LQHDWLTQELKSAYSQGSEIEYDPKLTEQILENVSLSGYQDKARTIMMRFASAAAILILVIVGALGGIMIGNHLTGLIKIEHGAHPSVAFLMDETHHERIEFILTGNEELAK